MDNIGDICGVVENNKLFKPIGGWARDFVEGTKSKWIYIGKWS